MIFEIALCVTALMFGGTTLYAFAAFSFAALPTDLACAVWDPVLPGNAWRPG